MNASAPQASARSSYATTSAVVFALVALFQLYRATMGLVVEIDHRMVPVAISWAIALFAGAMAFWGWRSR